MTKYYLTLSALFLWHLTFGQCMTTGGFESPEWTTHSSGTWTETTSEGTWSAISSYVNGGNNNSGSNKFGMNGANDELVTPAYTDPCDLSFYVRTSSDPDNWVMAVQTSTNPGGPWTTQTTVTENGAGGTITNTYTQINVALNLTGTYYIRFFVVSRSAGSIYLDDISLTCGCSSNTITTGAVSGNPFTVDCNGTDDTGTVDFTSVGTFTGGNVYTAELSDATGSFASPTTIGTLTSTANSGTINITIPAATSSGAGYLIRILSDSPVVTGTNSSAFTITQVGSCGPTLPTGSGLIINEWSNGDSGNREFYEFVVSGECGDTADIRGYILDDNNATFTNPADYDGTASGIAPGHFRFTNAAQWGAIPVGSLIVVYNADDPNTSLPADDPTDANNDSLYVVPHNSTLFERCTTFPTTTDPDSIYTGCTYATAPLNGWNPLSLRNSGDAIQVRQPDGTYYHGVSYGGSEITGGPNNLKLFTGSGSGMCGWFSDGDFFDASNWSSGTVSGNETPGVANNALNLAWLYLMRDPNGATCPVTVLPVEIFLFDGRKTEYGNVLRWSTSSEHNSDYFLLERSTDGKLWEEIGTVKSAGNSDNRQDYQFVDIDFREVVNYYRLKQLDLDGTESSHFKIVSLDNSRILENELIGRYNILGQKVDENYKGVQLLLFRDGSTKRILNY